MNSWQNLKLGEIVSIKTGKIDANKAVENGKYPFFTCAKEISRINDAPYEGKVVLVAGNGDLNVKYYEGKFNAYQRTYFLTSLDEKSALPRYIYFFMEHYLQILRTQSIGTTVKYIKMENLSDAIIPLPSIEEQLKIVELLDNHLSRLDAALVDVQQAKLKAAQFRRSLLQAAFTGNLGSEGTTSMTEIPSDWRRVTLDEAMSNCKNGLTYRNNPELNGFPVSRIETIAKGEIDFQKVGYGGVSLEGNQKHLLKPGDILFSHINSMLHVGKVAIYKSGMPALLHGMNLLRVTPSDDFMPEFLFYLFQSSDVRKQIWSKAKHAVNQASINIGELKTVTVPKPPIDEQRKIVGLLEYHLSRLEVSVSVADAMEKQSNVLRRSLLQAAFTGQLTKEVVNV